MYSLISYLQNYVVTLPVWGTCMSLKGQYRHDQSRLSTGHGHGMGVLVKMNTVTEN